MTVNQDIWEMEEKFWTDGADLARKMTSDDAVYVFPGPNGILFGDTLSRNPSVAQRWRSAEMSDRYIKQNGNIIVLAYKVVAQRLDLPAETLLCSSAYLLDDDRWQRITHQQTSLIGPIQNRVDP